MSYTANIFNLLPDEGEDRTTRKQQTPKPSAPKPGGVKPAASSTTPKVAASQQPAAPPAPAKPAAAAKKEGADVKPQPQGATFKGKTDYVKKANAHPRPQGANGGQTVNALETDKPARAPRQDSRERPPQRGRQFDRRSGTGRPPNENKKGGAGTGNWGNIKEQGADVEGVAASEAVESEEKALAPEVATEADAAAAPPKEEEKEGITYDEYLESIKGKTVKGVEAPKLRLAGEGVDQAAWADYAPLSKDDEDEPLKKKKVEKVKKEAGSSSSTAAKGMQKVSVNDVLNVRMSRPVGDRGDRGDRRDRPYRDGDRPPRDGDRPHRERGDRADRPPRDGDRPRGGDRGAAGKSPKAPRNDRPAGGQLNGAGRPFTDGDFPVLSGSGGVAAPTTTAPASTPAPATTQQSQAPVKA